MVFEEYLSILAKGELKKMQNIANDRELIMMASGLALSHLGDYVSNPNLKWEFTKLNIDQIVLPRTNPEVNKICIEKCDKDPQKLFDLIESRDPETVEILKKYFSTSSQHELVDLPVIVIPKNGKYKILDGIHRFVKELISGETEIECFKPINFGEVKPYCEPHIIYDLIKAFQRSPKDIEDKTNLEGALKLLNSQFDNVKNLLKESFCFEHVADEDVQDVIQKI